MAAASPISTPIGSGYRSVNVALRKEFDLYAGIRPCRSMEGIDLGAGVGLECEVQVAWPLRGLEQAQRRRALGKDLDSARRPGVIDGTNAERLQDLEKEGLGRSEIADSELDVVKHECS